MKFGPWQVLRELGRGGQATTYLARRRDELAAVKVLHSRDDRGLRERRLLDDLQEVKGIPAVLDHRFEDNEYWIAMEFVEGSSLDQVFEEWMDDEHLVRMPGIAQEFATIVAHIHEAGVTHRDIKPSNVLLDQDGKVWLVDLGLGVGESGHTQTTTHAWMGTPDFAAPELDQPSIRFKGLESSADIYSMAVTIMVGLFGGPVGYAISKANRSRQVSGPWKVALSSEPRDRPSASVLAESQLLMNDADSMASHSSAGLGERDDVAKLCEVGDLDSAGRLARSIADRHWHDRALRDVARAFARNGDAHSAAAELEDCSNTYWKSRGLFEVARELDALGAQEAAALVAAKGRSAAESVEDETLRELALELSVEGYGGS